MSRKEQHHGGVKLTAKTARTLAIQEFGTARGLTKSTSFVGAYFMEFGNLRIEICADAACIAVRVVLAHGTGSSVKYFDPDTLQENFKAMVTKGIMSVVRQIPAGAKFTVEVCNNGNDASPTWEDVTQNVVSGSKFFLSNTTKTASAWGYNFRIKVKRGTATGDCFITSAGGNFE